MKIWELGSDGDSYDNIGVVGDYNLDYMRTFDGRCHIKNWKPLAVEFMPIRKGQKRKGFANITNVQASPSEPVMDKKAIDALKNLMFGSVEILPLDFDEKDFYLINVTEVLDCIDLEKSEYKTFPDSGEIRIFIKYVLKKDVLAGKHIFRMAADYTKVPYVSDVFKKCVIDNDLKGFRFRLIWDIEDEEAPTIAQAKKLTERKDKADYYINLKKGNIPNIPEDELINAIRTWIYGKLNQNSKNIYSIISVLPKPCQYVFSMDNLICEVEQGGFNQFFYNFDKRIGKLAEDGFRELKLDDVADIVSKANHIFKGVSDKLTKDSNNSIENFMETYKDNPLNDIGNEFCNIKSLEKWEDICIKYIKFCAFAFGD